jgi:hypothetical protein
MKLSSYSPLRLLYRRLLSLVVLILYIFRATVLCKQSYFQQTEQYKVLMLLHVSAINRSHLQIASVRSFMEYTRTI